MKILKRNYEHRNLILFLFFSLIYLQAIYSLSQGQSVFNQVSFRLFFANHYLIIALTLFTIYMVLKIKKYSDKILMFCLSVIVCKNFIMLATSFNKLILGLNFIYLIFAFYFFIVWELELGKASYNPGFSKHDLEKNTRFNIRGTIEDDKGSIFEILITNIDHNSCFALLDSPSAGQTIMNLNPGLEYKLSAEYEGINFTQMAELTSKYDQGVGLNLLVRQQTVTQLNWSDLYKVCLERGLFS